MKTKIEAAADAIMEHCYDGAQALRIAQAVLTAAAQHQPLADLMNAEDEDDSEINRILALSGDELRAELVAEGHDPDALVRQMERGLDGTLRLAADRQRWREVAASWRRVAERLQERTNALEVGLKPFAAILADGEPVGPIPRGHLDSRITRNDLRRATKLLAAEPPPPELSTRSSAPAQGKTEMGGLCPICGETAPEPSTLCLRRVANIAEQGAPCDYSQEGEARFANEIGVEKAALVMGALDQPPASSGKALTGKAQGLAKIIAAKCKEVDAVLGPDPWKTRKQVGGIYIASKTAHAQRWRQMRADGLPIISTWIDEAGKGDTACFTDLWQRCVDEASTADAVIVYREPGEVLKGAFVEVGAALSVGTPVYAIGCDEFSFVHHASVTRCADLRQALELAAPPASSGQGGR